MQTFPASPLAMLHSLIKYRSLIYQMSKREVIGRYKGSVMGLFWSFSHPVFMLLVYTFVFGAIFQSRWKGVSHAEFPGILFSGLIVYTLFAECANRASSLVVTNVNYVKKVVFPLEVLSWVAIGSALFQAFISIGVLLVYYLIVDASLAWTSVLLPVVLLPLLLLIMGVVWFLAALGVYLRDIGEIVKLLTLALMFLSPIFYPATAFPAAYRAILDLNPLTFMIEQFRNVLLWGKLPDFVGLGWYALISFLVAWAGFWWFQKSRKGFADVL